MSEHRYQKYNEYVCSLIARHFGTNANVTRIKRRRQELSSKLQDQKNVALHYSLYYLQSKRHTHQPFTPATDHYKHMSTGRMAMWLSIISLSHKADAYKHLCDLFGVVFLLASKLIKPTCLSLYIQQIWTAILEMDVFTSDKHHFYQT